MQSFLTLVSQVIEIYIWLVIASAVLSWLSAFDVINFRNRFVYTIADIIYRLTEPAFRLVRSVVPTIGGLDLSPIIIIFGLAFLRNLMWEMLG
jgi:YggT family protein